MDSEPALPGKIYFYTLKWKTINKEEYPLDSNFLMKTISAARKNFLRQPM